MRKRNRIRRPDVNIVDVAITEIAASPTVATIEILDDPVIPDNIRDYWMHFWAENPEAFQEHPDYGCAHLFSNHPDWVKENTPIIDWEMSQGGVLPSGHPFVFPGECFARMFWQE